MPRANHLPGISFTAHMKHKFRTQDQTEEFTPDNQNERPSESEGRIKGTVKSGKGEGPRDQQQRSAITIMFREEVRGNLFLGTKWPNRHRFRGKDLAGEEEKKCHNGTLLCIISLNLTNPAGARGEETQRV